MVDEFKDEIEVKAEDTTDVVEEKKPEVVEEKPKKRRGRPAAKKKDDLQEQAFKKLLDEVQSIKEELSETKSKLASTKSEPVSVRLEKGKKKLKNYPPYSGPTQRVKFMRNDQPENPMNACLRKVVYNTEKKEEELLNWKDTLTPGRVYELPVPVVEFLNSRSEPTYAERQDPENPRQTVTQIVGDKQRCYCVAA